jgi:ATP citrate (pro-S)-lyase
LNNFIIEPFLEHEQANELYICIYSQTDGETILFHHEGGIDIGDVDSKSAKHLVPISENLKSEDIVNQLLINIVDEEKKTVLSTFIMDLFVTYRDLHFTYLEINPLVILNKDNSIHMLDLAAKIDQTAEFLCRTKWGGDITFPNPFGREAYPEEKFIADLDARSGASLKLTILNKSGRIWTMVAGGGASVIYSDTICDQGGSGELANYGEYSGAPSEQQTYEYAKTILDLMTREKHPKGKCLIIGGGIANFTNVAATFKGIVKAIKEYKDKLINIGCSIFVRRGGPNYEEGIRIMKELSKNLNLPISVFGPETHMTSIVSMALATDAKEAGSFTISKESLESNDSINYSIHNFQVKSDKSSNQLFTNRTKSIVWGLQTKAIQSMLDFDHLCSRKEPSVCAIIYPFG